MTHTAAQAADLWCPMVRIARREDPDPTAPGTGTVVVAGVNTDALGRARVPASCRCIASACAMWRWTEPAPALRDEKTWWPEEDSQEAVELMRTVEPPRPTEVGAGATWVPVTGPSDDCEGGYWTEDPAAVRAENAAGAARRLGLCGLAGKALC